MPITSSPSSLNAREVWSRLLGAIYFVCLAGLLLAMGFLLVRKPLLGRFDFWAHAAVGRWIWQNGHVPDRTLFLWTASEPWVYQSWLFQLLCYGLTEIGPPEQIPYVVTLFTTVLALLPFALVCAVWGSLGRLSCWMAVPLLLTIQVLAVHFIARPELFTVLFLCILMTFLLAWSRVSTRQQSVACRTALPSRPDGSEEPSHRSNFLAGFRRDTSDAGRIDRWEYVCLAGVLLLFLVWVNLHGAMVLGLLLLVVTACADLIQDRFDRRSRMLVLLTAVVTLVLCINPYGVGYWRAYRPVGTVTFAHILEWQPIWKSLPLPAEKILVIAAVAILALAAWAMNANRRLAQLGWILLMGGFFAFARRNAWPFTLTCLMVLAANARSLDPELLWRKISQSLRRSSRGGEETLPSLFRWLIRTALLAWLVLQCLDQVLAVRPWEPLPATRLERGVARFIRDNDLSGRVFNDYENSSYLQWALAGQPPLYIDLLNAYPDEVMVDYLNIVHLSDRGCELLDERQIDLVVLTTTRASALSLSPLADYLDANDKWARVFVGKDGIIWVRRTPAYAHLWKPVIETLSKVSFGTLERWGEDANVTSSAIGPEDVGGRKKP